MIRATHPRIVPGPPTQPLSPPSALCGGLLVCTRGGVHTPGCVFTHQGGVSHTTGVYTHPCVALSRGRMVCVRPYLGGVCMPRAPKQCGYLGCPVRVRGRTYCVDHTPVAWQGSHTPMSTWAHRKLRTQVLEEEPLCRDCMCARSTDAGHIIPASQGGLYVRDNLKGQCRPCNLAQIAKDRQTYSREQ